MQKNALFRKGLVVGIILLFIGTSIIPLTAQKIDITSPLVLDPGGNHAPIRITNNDEFTSANGVTGGSGTVNDPYRIENWMIVRDNSSVAGIFIGNTSAYFIIRNCSLSLFNREFNSGIKLFNVMNGRIDAVEASENYYGISLSNSSKIEIVNCTFHDNDGWYAHGVDIWYSHDITISSCNCSKMRGPANGEPDGISLVDSYSCLIDHCASHDNMGHGIDIMALNGGAYPSRYNTIQNCRCYNNSLDGIEIGAYDALRKKDMGHARISNCTISNNGHIAGYDDALAGIYLFETHHNVIENCDIDYNGEGINIDSGSNNMIRNCSISHQWQPSCAGVGVLIGGEEVIMRFAINNTVEHCDIFNQETGIWNSEGLRTNIHHNKIYNNTVTGVYAQVFLGINIVKIRDNNIVNNKGDPSYGLGESGLLVDRSTADARNNWWGSSQGPSISIMFTNNRAVIPLRKVANGDTVIYMRGFARIHPWLSESVPDAGRQT